MSILSWYGVDRPEDTIDGSLDEMLEDKEFLPLISELLAEVCPCWKSIPMFPLVDIVGNSFFGLESIVELLKIVEEKGDLDHMYYSLLSSKIYWFSVIFRYFYYGHIFDS